MWKKLKAIALTACVAVVGLTAPAQAELSDILSAGKIKIGVPENFPPFGSLGAEGEYEGYDVDVAKLIAKDLEVELELVPVTSKQRQNRWNANGQPPPYHVASRKTRCVMAFPWSVGRPKAVAHSGRDD